MIRLLLQVVINNETDLPKLNATPNEIFRLNNSIVYTGGPVTQFGGILIGYQTTISYTAPCGAMSYIFGTISGTIKNVSFNLKYECSNSAYLDYYMI